MLLSAQCTDVQIHQITHYFAKADEIRMETMVKMTMKK
jgi:hypothetical protein